MMMMMMMTMMTMTMMMMILIAISDKMNTTSLVVSSLFQLMAKALEQTLPGWVRDEDVARVHDKPLSNAVESVEVVKNQDCRLTGQKWRGLEEEEV